MLLFKECRWAVYLLLLHLADLVWTVLGLSKGWVEEGNPLFAYLWMVSPALFCLTKVLMVGAAFAILGVVYRIRPVWICTMTRLLFIASLSLLLTALLYSILLMVLYRYP